MTTMTEECPACGASLNCSGCGEDIEGIVRQSHFAIAKREEIAALKKKQRELEVENEHLKKQLLEGVDEGEICNRRCQGKMRLPGVENCSCFISAPCAVCKDNRTECDTCGEGR